MICGERKRSMAAYDGLDQWHKREDKRETFLRV